MFFVIGLVVFLAGCLSARVLGTSALEYQILKRTNKYDTIGGLLIIIGALLMLYSICRFLWGLLP